MMLEIGGLGACLQKNFEMVPSEMSDIALLHGEMNFLVFIIRNHTEKEKLVLLNFQDLELKKKILQRILLSTVAWMYTGTSQESVGWGCKAEFT